MVHKTCSEPRCCWYLGVPWKKENVPRKNHRENRLLRVIPHPDMLFWHTFWHTIWKYPWQIYPDILFWHSFWHSIWHLFRHTLWHLFWHSIYLSGNEIRGAVHSHIRNDFTADPPSRGSDTLWPFGAGWCSLFVIWYVSFLQLWSL